MFIMCAHSKIVLLVTDTKESPIVALYLLTEANFVVYSYSPDWKYSFFSCLNIWI